MYLQHKYIHTTCILTRYIDTFEIHTFVHTLHKYITYIYKYIKYSTWKFYNKKNYRLPIYIHS